ncbi:gamma-aminobutyric acid receptor subunit beta-2-like isoform X1 [Argiope bruennichi]|uniref:gamma-aminobutyric acid receptor subunit beta-2-like isoform X1 n=2 Tax=Argiope bruennichi TaxID=94029 RepID=UPI002494F421|nr:gamma-aminobutyric acid receptor subunit beta-2-like isoform X1 [Argiope bruennichi]
MRTECRGKGHSNMISSAAYLITFQLLFLIGFVEPTVKRPHAVEWEHQETLFAKLTNKEKYNHRLRPYATRNAVRVNNSMFIYSISSIDEVRTEYSMQILYRQTWIDERLKFPPNSSVPKIVGDNWHAQRIWTPSIHAVNDKELGSFTSGGAEGTILMHIHPDGQVLLSKRVKLRAYCEMQFYRYPMDKQQCTLEIESSTLPNTALELAWSEQRALELNHKFLLTGFILTNYTLENIIFSYQDTGNFSRITVRFNFEREFGHFVLDVYIPTMLFVVTSWLSFYIEIPAAPARVTLSITTMLTLVTSERAIREKLPKVSYVHALDIWNVVCTGFVFASLVEYALVNYIYHKDKRKRKKNVGMKRAESTATFCSMESDTGSNLKVFSKKGELEPGMPNKKAASFASFADVQSVNQMEITCGWPLDEFKMTPQDIANSIDRKCRVIFPAGFIVFNIIYWLVLFL